MQDEKFRIVDSKWTGKIEQTLQDIGDRCIAYKWMNILSARNNEKKYNILMYCSILLGPITGIISAISAGDNVKYIIALQVLITTFSFVNGVISAITKFSEFGEKAFIYKNIASKYASLENNIKRQLSLSRSERVNPASYSEWITSSFDDIFTSSPLISDDIYTAWTVFAKKHNLTVKEIVEPVRKRANTEEVCKTEEAEAKKDDEEEAKENPNKKLEKPKSDTIEIVVQQDFSDGRMRYELERLSRM
jgi:hypothetical protein